jgi:hypothetical protein
MNCFHVEEAGNAAASLLYVPLNKPATWLRTFSLISSRLLFQFKVILNLASFPNPMMYSANHYPFQCRVLNSRRCFMKKRTIPLSKLLLQYKLHNTKSTAMRFSRYLQTISSDIRFICFIMGLTGIKLILY